MGESKQHKKLVELLVDYIVNKVGDEYSCFIEADSSDGYLLPPLTQEGYRPDAMYHYNDMMIIGEAKTPDDINKEHSLCQYRSYLKKCHVFDGKAIFVLAVPWEYAPIAYNTIKGIKAKYPGDYEIEIIKGFGI